MEIFTAMLSVPTLKKLFCAGWVLQVEVLFLKVLTQEERLAWLSVRHSNAALMLQIDTFTSYHTGSPQIDLFLTRFSLGRPAHMNMRLERSGISSTYYHLELSHTPILTNKPMS